MGNENENMDTLVEKALLDSALSGNTTALIFWLKNKRPDLWRDKPEGGIADNGIMPVLLECWNKKKRQ